MFDFACNFVVPVVIGPYPVTVECSYRPVSIEKKIPEL